MSENSSNGPTPDEPTPGGGAEGTEGADASKAAVIAREVEELERRSQTAARLFDVRRIIGGLFVVYGLIVGLAGVFASHADIKKAENVNINLWTGIGMLVLGVVFLVWLKLSPTIPPPAEDGDAPAPQGGGGEHTPAD